MKRCIIACGAPVNNYDRIKKLLREDDFFVCCDSGLRHAEKLCRTPDLIVGDFDSWERPSLPVETIVLPREKDDTDGVYAIREMVKRGYDEFILIGAAGERLDHTLVNVSVLLMLHSLRKKAVLIDDFSQMEIVGREHVFIDDSYSYFSLLAVEGSVSGVYERNVKYPLENAEITSEYQYGTGNEVLPGKVGEVWAEGGRLLLIKVF